MTSKINSEDLTKFINLAIESVDKSKFGPMFIKNEKGESMCSGSAWETYKIILNCICPKQMNGSMEIIEPNEEWKSA